MRSSLAAVLGLVGVCACDTGSSASSAPMEWSLLRDSVGTVSVHDSPDICGDCIAIERLTILGDHTGPGYVEETRYAVRDSLGRYWVNQRNGIKVFGPHGAYVGEIGRPGEGPLEFGYPIPVHTDASGNVHIVDPSNIRESVVNPDFALVEDRRLPGRFTAAEALSGTDEYLVNMWLPTPEQIGYPLHIVRGSRVLRSFGASPTSGPTSPFRNERLLTSNGRGQIFTAKYYDYELEAWTESGERITGLTGPVLNAHEVQPKFFNRSDNPMPAKIMAIKALGSSDQIWVLTRRVEDDWERHYVNHTYPNGLTGLVFAPGSTMDSVFYTRIELLDVADQTIVARIDREELFSSFIGGNLLLENRNLPNGTPQLGVWRLEADLPLDQ